MRQSPQDQVRSASVIRVATRQAANSGGRHSGTVALNLRGPFARLARSGVGRAADEAGPGRAAAATPAPGVPAPAHPAPLRPPLLGSHHRHRHRHYLHRRAHARAAAPPRLL